MSQINKKCLTKSNFLIYDKPQGERETKPCRHKKIPTYSAVICRVPPRVIKVCTGPELKKMCPPPCDCSKVFPKNRFGALGFLLFGLKASIAAAVIYISYDMGIWGSTDDTQEMYRKFCTTTGKPTKRNTKWDLPSCEAQKNMFPTRVFKPYDHCNEPAFNKEKAIHNFQNNWNKGVQCVFGAIVGFPSNLINWYCSSCKNNKKETDKRPRCIPYSQLPPAEKVVTSYK